MKHVIRGLTFLLISVVVNGILRYLRENKQAEYGKVHLPKLIGVLGMGASVLFLIPTVITAFTEDSLGLSFFFFLFSMLSASLIVGYVNCRISYDEEGFVAKSFFGIKRKYTYDQVTAIKENTHESYLYVGKRRVMVDEFSIGGKEFIKLVKKKYRTMHNGESLPKIYKTKHDIFNGHVRDSGQFLAVYILLGVICLGLLIFSIVYAYFSPASANNTVKQSVSFVSCDVSNDTVILTSADRQIYKIRFIDDRFDTESIRSICDGKSIVTAYSKEMTPEDADPYYSIRAIETQGHFLLSFAETERLHRQENTMLVLFMAGMCLIWGAVVAFSIIVGRNPQKFSKRFVRLFFKDGYIRYDIPKS